MEIVVILDIRGISLVFAEEIIFLEVSRNDFVEMVILP